MENKSQFEESRISNCENLLESGGSTLLSSEAVTASHKDCLDRVPKNTLTFLAQIVVVYGIIAVSVYHLSVQSPNQELWLILLSSAFGYILPSPGLKYLKQTKSRGTNLSYTPLSSVDIDETDAVVVTDREKKQKKSSN